jgi:hypothetical protein
MNIFNYFKRKVESFKRKDEENRSRLDVLEKRLNGIVDNTHDIEVKPDLNEKKMSVMGAILDILSKENKPLNCKQIFNKIVEYKLYVNNCSIQSVYSATWNLKKSGKINCVKKEGKYGKYSIKK